MYYATIMQTYASQTLINSELADRVAEFLLEKRQKKSPATAEQYRFVLERVLLPWAAEVGHDTPALITDKQMDGFAHSLKQRTKPLSNATIRTYLRAVRVFLTWADVPRGKFEQPSKVRRLRDILTREEIDAMEKATRDERDKLIVRVLADTGIRVSELLGLRGVDLRANGHDRKYLIRVIGKGDSEREVAIPAPVFDRLRNLASHGQPTDYIFLAKRRTDGHVERLTRSGVGQLVRHLAVTAKLTKRVHPHAFRHAYTSHMLIKGVNPVVLQKTLGHSTLAMISETYSHILGSDAHDMLMKALA